VCLGEKTDGFYNSQTNTNLEGLDFSNIDIF